MKSLILLLCTLFVYPAIIRAQYSVDTNLTVNQYVERLLGSGIEFSNAHIYGDRQAIGYFSDPNGQLGLDKGIILSNGQASSSDDVISNFAGGSNFNGLVNIPELAAFVPGCFSEGSTNDGIILQFDFIPHGDSISLQYIFASEEYNEYVCSAFNDAFAIFISGPGINGEENLTFVPGSGDPITINSINNGSAGGNGDTLNDPCILTNAQYFNTNPPSYIVYDGCTNVLTAEKEVIPCQTYTLRIMIADGCDSGFDSAVFLKTLVQLSTGPTISSNLEIYTPSAYEDCSTLDLTFSKPDSVSGDFTFYYSISGSAINGIDYSFLPDSIIVPAGQNSTSISLDIYQDNQTEGIETIIFNYSSLCGETVSMFQIDDQKSLELASSPVYEICSDHGPITMYVEVAQGIPPFTYSWLNYESSFSGITVNPTDTTTYRVYVTDQCGSIDSTDFIVNVFSLPDTLILNLDTLTSTISFIEPEGEYIGYWLGGDTLNEIDNQPQLTLTAPGNYTVYLQFTYGCQLFSNTIQFNPTGIAELNQISFKLFPNPADDYFSISVFDDCNLEIYDLAGKLLENELVNKGTQFISTVKIPQGLYIVKLGNSTGCRMIKLLVTH
jgi:hypothetical protein